MSADPTERKIMMMNKMRVYDPFREMENFFAPFRAVDLRTSRAFRTDIRDTGKAYELEAELPGFAKEDIALDIEDDILTIRAEHSENCEKNDEDGRYLCRERSWGSYERRFDLSGVDQDEIRAKYENGILQLTLPKRQPTAPQTRRLTID